VAIITHVSILILIIYIYFSSKGGRELVTEIQRASIRANEMKLIAPAPDRWRMGTVKYALEAVFCNTRNLDT
jgi:hypothetical protein